jgi:hypothetical protein
MRYILTIALLICGGFAFGQDNIPTKLQFKKLFKENTHWTICNQDSAFYKSDTLRLYSNVNYFYQKSSCCNFVDWIFYKNNSFLQKTSQVCKEPATTGVISNKEKYTLILASGKLFLLNYKGHIEYFEVVSLLKIPLVNNNSTIEITLKRLTPKTIVGPLH